MFPSNRAREIFLGARDLAAKEQATFVEEACQGDAALFQEVKSLLDAESSAGDYFEQLSDRISVSALSEEQPEKFVGKEIGNWRIIEALGRGGMGVVYHVERSDGAYQKKAALKILPLGLDSDQARTRFMQERQILARLDHNNIAHLIDGGVSEEGVPYFVMDVVQGEAIDDYCQNRFVSLEDKLRLVLQIGRAVQYAHRNLVIHRDLKPSNVLVQEDGQIRLLDFGIAKILETDAGSDFLTRSAFRPVTPAFASPEMLRGEDVDVTTDVYSLGVLTYLILGQKLPLDYEGLTGAEIIQQVASQRPPLLEIDPDLDAIIGKCLAKTPSNRYLSMESFCGDLENFLGRRPVVARSQTSWYRFTRFVSRNRGSLSVAALVLLAITLTTALALVQSFEAKRQRDLAQREQQRVQATNEFFGLLLEEIGSKPFTTVELLDRGTSLLEQQFGVDEAFMAPVLYEVSRRYSSIGEKSKQIELLKQTETLSSKHGDLSMHATALCRLSRAYVTIDPELAADYESRANAAYNALRHPSIGASHACLRMRAKSAQRDQRHDDSLNILLTLQEILDDHPSAATHLRGTLLNEIGYVYFLTGEMDQAVAHLQQTLTLLESTGRGGSYGYLQVAANLAVLLGSAGRLQDSLAIHEDIVTKIRNSGYQQRGASRFFEAYGISLARVKDMERAEEIFEEGVKAAELTGDEANLTANRLGLVKVLLSQQRYDEALDTLEVVNRFLDRNESASPVLRGSSIVLHAKVLRNMGRLQDAREVVDGFLDQLGYPNSKEEAGLLSAMTESAAVHQALQNYEYAESLVDDLIARLSRRSRDLGDGKVSVDVARSLIHRAEIRSAQTKHRGAIEDLERALPTISQELGESHSEVQEARSLLESVRQDLAD